MEKTTISRDEALETIGVIREGLSAKSSDKSKKRKYKFQKHLVVYIIVIAGLWFVNLSTNPAFLWAIFPTLGWGVGIVSHYLKVYR